MTKVVLHTCPSISRTRSQTDLDYVQGFSLLFPLQQYSGYNCPLASAPLPLRHLLPRRRRLFPLNQGDATASRSLSALALTHTWWIECCCLRRHPHWPLISNIFPTRLAITSPPLWFSRLRAILGFPPSPMTLDQSKASDTVTRQCTRGDHASSNILVKILPPF